MMIEFTKYQGLGNDFILIDNRNSPKPIITPDQAVKICDRHFGIGADGVIFLLPPREDTDYAMRIFNSDGSEPEMCGNGIRCLARFVAELTGNEEIGQSYRIHTLAGVITPQLQANGQVTVDMGLPQLTAQEIPTTLGEPTTKVINQTLELGDKSWLVTCVSMGNPHCIIFVADVEAISLETVGSVLENHPVFPQRTNVEFIQVIKKNFLKMRVWERGAGITLACGTGACAAVVAGVLTNHCHRHCGVELPGGLLEINWSESDQKVYMTGDAEKVFTGNFFLGD